MILTPHFGKKEFASKDGAGMPKEVWQNIKKLAANLEVLREHLGQPIHINSGFRSEAYNNKVGGKKNSQHVKGKAADITVDKNTPNKVYKAIEKLIKEGKMSEGGLGLYDTFVPYDIRGKEAGWVNTTRSSK
jgi:uncharacterized protein YcbK (DUF882 family)